MDGVAVAIAEHLDLDVARLDDRALEDHGRIAERALRFGSRAAQRVGQRGGVLHQPHAAAAAAGHRLDHHREADLAGLRDHRGIALIRALVAGHARHAGLQHDLLGAGLVAHRGDRLRRRADEHQPGIAAGRGEILVLGEEAVAGMHRVGAGDLRGFDQRRDVEIGLATAARRRSPPPRRLRGHARRRRRRSNTPRRRRSPCGARCASRAARSRRGWRSGSW